MSAPLPLPLPLPLPFSTAGDKSGLFGDPEAGVLSRFSPFGMIRPLLLLFFFFFGILVYSPGRPSLMVDYIHQTIFELI